MAYFTSFELEIHKKANVCAVNYTNCFYMQYHFSPTMNCADHRQRCSFKKQVGMPGIKNQNIQIQNIVYILHTCNAKLQVSEQLEIENVAVANALQLEAAQCHASPFQL